MLIHWYGHAAFLIVSEGKRIILDPFRSPDSGGMHRSTSRLMSSWSAMRMTDTTAILARSSRPSRLSGLELPEGGRETLGVRFEAIRVFESPEKPAEDEVTIVHFRLEGLHVVFLGDLGHALDEAELVPIRGADVVLVPAGGSPTIDFPLLAPLLEAIGPRIVIPMHYKTPRINLNIQPVERFFEALPGWPVEGVGSSEITITRDTLPENRRIVSLEPSR